MWHELCPILRMSFLSGSDRQQTHLLPLALEDYIGADNPVRFLDASVAKLDLLQSGFLFRKQCALGSGRPGYHPADLLKLYLY
jgi:transposase